MKRISFTQRGLSLVELMVALGLSLLIVGAAAYLYLATRENQGKLDQAVEAADVGNYALRLLGREVGNAGFYPSAMAEAALPNVLNLYTNVTGIAAYNHGIFGCEGAPFDFVTNLCGATVAGAPDTLVIAYFTSDVDSGQGGQRRDCEGNDVALSGANTARNGVNANASPNVTPTLPLFAANHYMLEQNADTSMTFDGRTVSTRSLLCKGTVANARNLPARIISGLDDLQLLYGVTGAPAAAGQAPPQTFVPANQVAGLGALEIDGVLLQPWQRVVAVRICVISRTYLSANATSSGPQQWQDCNGVTQTASASDLSVRKTYTQVFSVRNHLKASY